jgi:hypothetical protein
MCFQSWFNEKMLCLCVYDVEQGRHLSAGEGQVRSNLCGNALGESSIPDLNT